MTVKAIMKKYSNHWNNENIPEKNFSGAQWMDRKLPEEKN